ncbi:MAG: hypothetical protein ACM30I_16340 [Gemmatimonas sp.]
MEREQAARIAEDLGALDGAELSALDAAVRAPGRRIAAGIDSGHFRLWSEMERLGWLREVPTEHRQFLALPLPTASFVVTDLGRTELPSVLDRMRARAASDFTRGRR